MAKTLRIGSQMPVAMLDGVKARFPSVEVVEVPGEGAIDAALEMTEVLEDFKRKAGEIGDHFDIGIGLHTGPAIVGFIGSEQRQDYTAIGDSVNLASRIEGLTKEHGRVLVSAETRNRCGEAFDFTHSGSYKVKGRSAEVELYVPSRRGTDA